MRVRPILPADRGSLAAYLALVSRDPGTAQEGSVQSGSTPGFLAEQDGAVVGAVLHEFDRGDARIVLMRGEVIAQAALIAEVVGEARRWGCGRVCVRVTNAELEVVKRLQRSGWDVLALRRDALTAARRRDPRLPTHSPDGIALRHEVELELLL